jgi:hypothetical protein
VAETTPFDATETDDDDETFMDGEEGLPAIIDLSNVEATSYELIPRGMYEGYIDAVEYGLSQGKGLPMLTWICKLDFEDKERQLRYWTTLAGDGAGRTKAFLAKLDPELDLSNLDPYAMDEHFSGMEVRIRVTIRPDREDRTLKRNNIADILPMEDEGFE